MGTIKILDWTMKDPLNCIGYNMATCYGTDNSKERNNIRRAMNHFVAHGRLQELPCIYMTIDGYSAKCLRELYTHIGGSPTRMQASTRYIDYGKGFEVVKPPKVEANKHASEIWDEAIESIGTAMNMLADCGIPVEDYTNLLPLAYKSKMILKMDLRCMINLMNMRLCSRAYWEMRQLAKDIKNALSAYSEQWKVVVDMMFVPKCEAVGYCTEHECCGRMPKKETLFKLLDKLGNNLAAGLNGEYAEDEIKAVKLYANMMRDDE